MNEKNIISSINEILNSKYIGDDCAYLRDLGIVVSHDSLVEDVHFSLEYTSAYQLGHKSVMVNISDICASGASPKYLTIALSIPKTITDQFIKEFYFGVKEALPDNVDVVGGDITGSEKVVVSVSAIGLAKNRNVSSRRNAKVGQKVVVSGVHGSSSAGFRLLQEGKFCPEKLLKAHLMPVAQLDFSKNIALTQKSDYAMMDTSDGLADAISQIAQQSDVNISIDFNKIPIDEEIKIFEDWKELVLFGGEDYGLVACIDDNINLGVEIGRVNIGDGLCINFGNEEKKYSFSDVESKIFNHFKGSEK